MPLVASLQIANARAPEVAPFVFAGSSVALILTLVDSVTQCSADPDVGSVAGTVTQPDGSTIAITWTQTGAGQFTAYGPSSEAGTYELSVTATSNSGALEIVTGGAWNVNAASVPVVLDKYVPVTGPKTVTGLPGVTYVCDITSGSVIINAPILTQDQTIGVIAQTGDFVHNSITVNSTFPQTLGHPPAIPGAPASSYVIGGPTATSGNGAADQGTAITWAQGGLSNVLPAAE